MDQLNVRITFTPRIAFKCSKCGHSNSYTRFMNDQKKPDTVQCAECLTEFAPKWNNG